MSINRELARLDGRMERYLGLHVVRREVSNRQEENECAHCAYPLIIGEQYYTDETEEHGPVFCRRQCWQEFMQEKEDKHAH